MSISATFQGRVSSADRVAVTRLRWLGAVGTAGALAFLSALVALHLLGTGLSPVADFVSDYANSPYGGLFATTAIVHAVGNLTMSVGLWLAFGNSRAGRWGVGLLAVASMGMLIAGAFPTDAPGAAQTVAGTIHRGAVTISFPLELVALVVLAAALRSALWRTHATFTRILSVLAAAALAWFATALAVGWPPGLPERATLAVFLVWELGTGIRLLVRPSPREEVAELS